MFFCCCYKEMSLNRIQKLLYSEYSDLEDVVLIESPFAEITKRGLGVRQVQLGLTPSKFIIARDVMKYAKEYLVKYWTGQLDPEIETMELISVHPIELVSLSVFQRRRRRILKARFHNGDLNCSPKISYFELGGLEKRTMFWNIWCEKVQFLAPGTQYNSISEASVGSSTSADSIRPSYTKVVRDKIWQHYEKSGLQLDLKDVLTVNSNLSEDEIKTLFMNQGFNSMCPSSGQPSPVAKIQKVNRFREGVGDQCGTDLFLPVDSYLKVSDVRRNYQFKNFEEFTNQCVRLWSKNVVRDPKRSYGLVPCPEFFHGAGLLPVDRSGKFTIQMRRTWSMVSVTDEYFPTSSMKTRNLVESQSCNMVLNRSISHEQASDIKCLYFWTTNFRYIPDSMLRKISRSRPRTREPMKSKRPLFFFKKSAKKIPDNEAKILQKLKNALIMSKPISIWSLDSNTLYSQLTIIDINLFFKISTQEFRMIKKSGSIRNCRNFTTWLTFSHRISCLVATQILCTQDTKTRARLVSRFIMVCDKCHQNGNYQSATSVLFGLCSPAVYRLYATWDRVRRFHSTAYRAFKLLCRDYKQAKLPDMNRPPYLPSAWFFLDAIFGRTVLSPVYYPSIDNDPSLPTPPSFGSDTSALTRIIQQILSTLSCSPQFIGKTMVFSKTPPEFSTDGISETSTESLSSTLEAENVLKASQLAARMYEMTVKNDAQEFLLKQPYLEHSANFQISLQIEPTK